MAALDFRAIFGALASPHMVLDRDLRYVAANAAYVETTGSRLEDLLGRPLFDAFPHDPEDPANKPAQVLRSSLEKVLRTRRPDVIAVIPYRVARTPGGPLEERFWSATHTPILDEQGEVAFIVQQTTDVTDVRRLEHEAELRKRALAVQESRDALDVELTLLRRVFDQTPGFFAFLRGKAHVFEITNGAYERLIGRSEIVGKPVREALPELAGQGFYELLDRVFETGEPYVGTGVTVKLTRREGADAEERIVDFVYQPIRSAGGGGIVGLLVHGNDVTERVRIETQQRFLARASEALTTAHDSIDQALLRVADLAVSGFADWCIVDLFDERGARRLARARIGLETLADEAWRYPAGPEPAKGHPTLGDDRSRPTVHDWDNDRATQIACSPEHAGWACKVNAHSVLGAPLVVGGRRVGALTFLFSVTARRFDQRDVAVAEELARIAVTVIDNALLAAERDQLLRREQAARERAEAASQAKDEFLAMLGHELRNPLSPILTAVQLLELRGDASSARERTVIARQTQHLVRLVDDLLDVARIARGKVEIQRRAIDLVPVVASAVEMASPLFEQKLHHLDVDVPDAPLVVDGDPVRLGQVVANLLTNAARYTNEGGHIALSARAERDEVVVRVRDDGIGISAELLPRVFELFVQGPRRVDRAEGGLGLGLTLVHSFVGMHGGRVEVRSDGPGRGSEFTVRLPSLATRRATDNSAQAASVKAEAKGSSRRVLIVDDNVDAAQLLAEMLELRGHRAVIAHDGPTALVEARRFNPEVALLDIGLPVMDGYELAVQMRATLGHDTPRLLAVTGYGRKNDRDRTRDAGFAAHIVKPVDTEALLRLIAEH